MYITKHTHRKAIEAMSSAVPSSTQPSAFGLHSSRHATNILPELFEKIVSFL